MVMPTLDSDNLGGPPHSHPPPPPHSPPTPAPLPPHSRLASALPHQAVPRLRVTDGPSLTHAEPPLPTAGFGVALNPPPPARVPRTPSVLAGQPGLLGPMEAIAHIVAMQDELDASLGSSGRDNP